MKDFIKSTSKIKSLAVLLSIFLFCSISVFGQFAQMGSKLVAPFDQQASISTISSNGKVLAIASYLNDNSNGAVWVYSLTGINWIPMGSKLINTTSALGKSFGYSISLSGDGKTIAIGGLVNPNSIGAFWIYTFSGSNWVQTCFKELDDFTVEFSPSMGAVVCLTQNGKSIAVGGDQDSAGIGAVWTYTSSGGNWVQLGEKLVGTGGNGFYQGQGGAIAMSSNGTKLIVGGSRNNNYAGGVWTYTLNGTNWIQLGEMLTETTSIGNSQFGYSVSMSGNGNILAVSGISDNQGIGAVWMYTFTGSNWKRIGGKLVGSGSKYNSQQGFSISLSYNGLMLAVGGNVDNIGIGGIWTYTFTGSKWQQLGQKLIGTGSTGASGFGNSVSLNFNGKILIGSGIADNSYKGAIWVFTAPGWNTDTVSTDEGTPTPSPISSDTLSISGTVHQGSGVLTDGIVMAIEKTTNASKILRVTNGNFTLDSLKRGEYMLYAVPNPVTVTNYLPTFYVNKVKLKDAITLSLRGHIRSVDIYLVPLPSTATLTGTHTITGRFSYESSSSADPTAFTSHWFSQNNKTATEIPITTQPCRQMPVLLLNAQNAVLKSVVTDSSGYFIVKNIPAGTYKLLGQRNGYASKNEGTVTVGTSTSEVANLRMEAVVTAFEDSEELTKGAPIVFPNPFQKTFEVKGFTGDLTVYDITGKVVYQNFHNENETISTETWPTGFYFLKMGEKIEKLIKQD